MKTVFRTKIITPAMILLTWTVVHAVEQMPPTAPVAPANAVTAAPAAAVGGKEKANAEASPTINMKIPLFSPDFATVPVALVNGEKIIIDDLTNAVATMHEERPDQATTARKSYTDILNRLINIKLMLQEAENIGLDQHPEIRNLVDVFERTKLRAILFQQQVKDVKADPNEVEKLCRDLVKECKLKSLLFTKEDDAKKMEQEIRKGKNFDELLEKAVKEGLATGSKEGAFMTAKGVQPQIVQAVAEMEVGSVSPVIPVESGFAIVMLEEVRFPENPEVREQVKRGVLNTARQKALEKYKDSLIKKHVKINTKLLKKLDFEAPKPGFKNLQTDRRTIAEIKGHKPVTVADLASAIKEKFFHGVAGPIKEGKVNVLKAELLDQILQKMVFQKEALLKGIDKTDEYRKSVKEYKESVIFGIFIENVVSKEVKVTEDELKAYYREHSKDKEYTYPGMIRLNGLAFTTMEAAQECIDKLKQGVDFKWLKENADNQVAENAQDLLEFTGNLVTTTSLPEGLRKVLTGIRSGDFRLFADESGHFYALHVKEFIPQREKSFEEAKPTIMKIVYEENFKKLVEDWAKKLRAASDIKVFVDFGEIS